MEKEIQYEIAQKMGLMLAMVAAKRVLGDEFPKYLKEINNTAVALIIEDFRHSDLFENDELFNIEQNIRKIGQDFLEELLVEPDL